MVTYYPPSKNGSAMKIYDEDGETIAKATKAWINKTLDFNSCQTIKTGMMLAHEMRDAFENTLLRLRQLQG